MYEKVFLLARADAVVEGREGSLSSFAHSDDDLLVGDSRAVSCCVDARDGGAATLVDDDLTTLELYETFERLRVGSKADLDEEAIEREYFFRSTITGGDT